MSSAFSSPTVVSSREWSTTDSGCRLHRSLHAPGIQNIVLQGKTIVGAGCVIRGDLQKVLPGRGSSAGVAVVGQGAVVGIGKYGYVGERTIIRPATTVRDGICTTLPFKIREYVHIGSDCIVQAASIGIWVVIGDGCVVGNYSVVKDGVQLYPGTVVPPGTNLPGMTRWAGNPAKMIAELPETTPELVKARAEAFYQGFKVQR